VDFVTFINSLFGRKIQKQIKAHFDHIQRCLDKASKVVELGDPVAYLTFDDKGKIVCRYCNPGQCPGPHEHGESEH
jgi:uncharacterized Zn-finger protein